MSGWNLGAQFLPRSVHEFKQVKLKADFVEASLDGVQVTNEGAFPLPLQLQAGQKANTKLQSKFPTTPMNRPLERENDIAWWTTGF